MPAPFVVPFNFQPNASSLRTTSYTVPAGKYARVRPVNADFTINGSLIASQATHTLSLASGTANATASYQISLAQGSVLVSASFTQGTFNGAGPSVGIYAGNSTATGIYTQARSTIGTTSSGTIAVTIPGTLVTFFIINGAIGASVSAAYIINQINTSSADFWVLAGTVLSGSSYFLEEYNVII